MSSPDHTNSKVQRDSASLSTRDDSCPPHLPSETDADNDVNSINKRPRGTSRRVVFGLPSPDLSFDDPRLRRRVRPQRWAPSDAEMIAVRTGAQNAQALLRKLETSVALWNAQLVTTMCGRHDLFDENKVHDTIAPILDPDSDTTTALYTNTINSCEREIRNVK
ncbi:hypothetical protein BGZ50_009873, partial [Haplosporangium sp. Z 11]